MTKLIPNNYLFEVLGIFIIKELFEYLLIPTIHFDLCIR